MFISQRQNLRTFGYVWWQREKERIKTVLIIKYTYFSTVKEILQYLLSAEENPMFMSI